MRNMEFVHISSAIIHKDRWLGLREDTVQGPDGARFTRKVVEYHPSAAVVARTTGDEPRVLLIRHYRHPIARHLWEIPGGMMEMGESPEQCVVREFREETGMEIRNIRQLLRYFPEPAFTDQVLTVCRGEILSSRPRERQMEEEIRESRLFSLSDIRGMIHSGEIGSSWSIIGLLLTLAGE